MFNSSNTNTPNQFTFGNNPQKSRFQTNQNFLNQSTNNNLYSNTTQNSKNYTLHQNPSETPKDAIQAIDFSLNSPNIFVACSWDRTARLYVIVNNNTMQQKSVVNLPHFPLACCFLQNDTVLVSLGDKSLYVVNFQNGSAQKCFVNSGNYFKILFVKELNIIVAASLRSLSFFQATSLNQPNFTLPLNFNILDINYDERILIVAMANDRFTILDIQTINMIKPNEITYNQSYLKSPLTTCSIKKSNKVLVLGSCDGRCYRGVFLDNSMNSWNNPQQKILFKHKHFDSNKEKNYVFIAHSKKTQSPQSPQQTQMFNITSMGMTSRSQGFLFTTGADGVLNLWDIVVKNKIDTVNFGQPVSCCAINRTGTVMAFGLGYDWSKGVWGLGEVRYTPKVGFRVIGEQDLVYKGSKKY